MTQSTFEFSSGPYLVYKINMQPQEFQITLGLIKQLTVIPFAAVRYFQIAKQLSKVKFVIHYHVGGKDKKLAISFDAYDEQSAAFVTQLKTLFPNASQWQNAFENSNPTTQTLSLPMTSKFLGKHMPRWGILVLWLVLSFPVFFYLLFTGGYLVVLSPVGFSMRKFAKKTAAWSEISKASFSLLDITQRVYGVNAGTERWMIFTIEKFDGKVVKFSMGVVEGAQFLKALIRYGKISADYARYISI